MRPPSAALGADDNEEVVGFDTRADPAPLGIATRAALRYRTAATILLALSWASGTAVQFADHDFLPPAISLSQYGVGPFGWLFTVYALGVAAAAVCCYLSQRMRGGIVKAGYFLGAAGITVMGLVRTDTGGAQASWHAKVHLVGAVVALVALPLAVWWNSRLFGRAVWVANSALTLVGAVSLVLLLLAAAGMDTAGMGAPASWAFWQAVAVLADQLLITVFLVALYRHGPAADR